MYTSRDAEKEYFGTGQNTKTSTGVGPIFHVGNYLCIHDSPAREQLI